VISTASQEWGDDSVRYQVLTRQLDNLQLSSICLQASDPGVVLESLVLMSKTASLLLPHSLAKFQMQRY